MTEGERICVHERENMCTHHVLLDGRLPKQALIVQSIMKIKV